MAQRWRAPSCGSCPIPWHCRRRRAGSTDVPAWVPQCDTGRPWCHGNLSNRAAPARRPHCWSPHALTIELRLTGWQNVKSKRANPRLRLTTVHSCCCCGLPLNLVPMAPSKGSRICTLMELSPVTSTTTEAGASGGRAWSQPSSMRRSPLTRRSQIPICLSTSLPVQPVTEEPVLPAWNQWN